LTLSRIFACSLIVAAVPVFASNGRQRAVGVLDTVTLHGVVRDSAGTPVIAAYVHSGTYDSGPYHGNGTNADGIYSITLPAGRPSILTIQDFAFEPVTITVTPTADATVDFTLTTPRPAVTVKLVSGETHIVDAGTSKFAYYRILADYMKFDDANLCATDGSSFALHKNDIARIVGPFTRVNFSPCCSRGPVVTARVEMKSGEAMQVYFNDSCYEEELDYIGRDRVTGVWYYLKFDDIAEIDFQ